MQINYDKNNGLVPAIVQDVNTQKVLMPGYMNEDALQKKPKISESDFLQSFKELDNEYMQIKGLLKL
jgi:phosphoribosyl-AMP cyclohydrolase / phosphoribosyl-ATP pyrophosphohydrolase